MAQTTTQTTIWRKSVRCGGSATCVEVAALGAGLVGARDSKRGPDAPALAVRPAGWASFVSSVRAGAFDL
ncbi:DUF397 domain-containing protein [Actinomadura rayongensis]|uniref:DUF397 domain-containing protein n=1 Tax=Actinomadura rayongensis TaxID=1429076 RepID=A0A6I4W0E3_9ACTN|nr:DUF397 domain-containing protein [Actinomadura rayongensis]MXQ62678.1 DUF397 domain-containing protein [Actinomadura rayongensis]